MPKGHHPSSQALGCHIVVRGSALLRFKAKQEQYTAVKNHALPNPSPRTYKAWVPSASKHCFAVENKPSKPGSSLEHATNMWRSSVWNRFFIIQLDESMPCLVSERPWWPELLSWSAAEGSFGYQYTGMKGHILGPAFGYQHDLASLAHSMDHRQQSHAWILAIQGQARTSEKEQLSWKYGGKSALLSEKVSYV